MRSGEGTADSWKCCERVAREEEGGVNAEMVAMMKAKNMSVQHLLLPPEERKRLAIVCLVCLLDVSMQNNNSLLSCWDVGGMRVGCCREQYW